MVADVRITIKVRNNRILRAMEARGIHNVAELGRQMKAAGLAIGLQTIHELIRMEKIPLTGKNSDRWRIPVEHLAQFLRCLPEDLFADWQRKLTLARSEISTDAEFVDLVAITNATPAIEYDRSEFLQRLADVLSHLPPRYERILRMRFGIGTEPKTLEEVAKAFNLSRERIRGIESAALQKMQHPSRSRNLIPFLEDFGIVKLQHERITKEDRHYVPQWKK